MIFDRAKRTVKMKLRYEYEGRSYIMLVNNIQSAIAANQVASTIISTVWYILLMVGMWKLFAKAGEPGWKSLIPAYNEYIIFKISWKPSMFWAMILCIAGGYVCLLNSYMISIYYLGLALIITALIIKAVCSYRLALSFGKGIGYTLGLWFFEPLFLIILGFGSARYCGNEYAE